MKVSVIGATGYTGFELVKLLTRHPHLEIAALTSESYAGQKISDIYPALAGICDVVLKDNDLEARSSDADAFFLCLPHKTAMEAVKVLYNNNRIVIDLSADFRMSDRELYEKTYSAKHIAPELLKEAVYGLPELFGDKLRGARLAAAPGCYPTSVIMPVYPLLKDGLADKGQIIADSKSGVSGAGRKPTLNNSFCETFGDFKPYGIFSHRHNVEIDHILSRAAGKTEAIFTPHLLPVHRGILSTIYLKSTNSLSEIEACWERYYGNSRLVRIKKGGEVPMIKSVAGTSFIDIAAFKRGGDLIIVSAIDNLLKGASGQALQCLNIMAGFNETEGLI